MLTPSTPTLVDSFMSKDERGGFVKIFPNSLTLVGSEIKEVFWSTSNAGVVRGMHLQSDPHSGWKLVFVIRGRIMDVCTNLHSTGSKLFETSQQLLVGGGAGLFVPDGFAHGFQALEDDTVVGYLTNHLHRPDHEHGFNPLSCEEINWPLPVTAVSERDLGLPSFGERSGNS